MKRAGFTMIELIFVIVIIGILAAVALPKLVGVQDQAKEGIVKGFVGTLNRTVGPSKWSKSLMDDKNGSVKYSAYDINASDTDLPQDLAAASTTKIDLTKCVAVSASTIATTDVAASGENFEIFCKDGNQSAAPRFWYRAKGASATGIPTDSNDLKID